MLAAQEMRAESDDGVVAFDLNAGKHAHTIYFASDTPGLRLSAEAQFAASLLPHMHAGEKMDIGAPLDAKFLRNMDEVQDIFACWLEQLEHVTLDGLATRSAGSVEPGEARVGAFFSGGADSFHTLLENIDEITDIIFVHGFDIKLDDHALRRQAGDMVERIGAAFGKNVIQVETNVRDALDAYLGWNYTHGAGLAAVAHLFSDVLSRVIIPASDTYRHLVAWGSHPVLDPFWSSSTLEFYHHGADKNRAEKIQQIAENQVALDALRVCWMNYDGAYNCGRCEKCQRTMIDLRIVGALERCTTFSAPLMTENILAMDGQNPDNRPFYLDSLKMAKEVGADREIIAALRTVLRKKSAPERWLIHFRRALAQPDRAIAGIRRRLGL